ncbi:MAG: PAAR domain-containing protein [Candidatus Accumulibacter sp.]|nr:PAAR domain-containing protein [Accumulibacter sp.]
MPRIKLFGKARIVVGDTTTHSGVVITGSTTVREDGIPVARKTDKVICPLCKPHVFVITEGFENCLDHGLPVAAEGHLTSCGARLVASAAGTLNLSGVKIVDMTALVALSALQAEGNSFVAQNFSSENVEIFIPASFVSEETTAQQSEECAHLLRDIQREEETIKKIGRAIKEYKSGQSLKDVYGLEVDATPQGYRGKQYETSSQGYKKAVDILEGDEKGNKSSKQEHAKNDAVGIFLESGNLTERLMRGILRAEKARNERVLAEIKRIYAKDCEGTTA